ncbi:MAG: hypothetical protein ABR907_08645 [Terracidiphilus sp.]|jgi:hypothetical protein
MKQAMSRNEIEMRSRFDFSRATRGRFSDRYKEGHSVTLLDGEPDMEDPLDTSDSPNSTRQAGKRIFISHVHAAGLKLAEPLDDKSIDYLIYNDAGKNRELISYAVKLKTSSHKTFYLYKKYERIPQFLLVYVWNARDPEESSVYALTYEEALRILEAKGYARTDSWIEEGGFSVTDAGPELLEMLKPYRMTEERWREKLQVA